MVKLVIINTIGSRYGFILARRFLKVSFRINNQGFMPCHETF